MSASRWLPLALFALLAALLAAGVWMSRAPDREALPSPLIGRAAPSFTLPLLHRPGETLSGDALRGAPYVLNVWGSWCPGCREEHAVLARLAGTGQVRVIGYNWKDERDDALRWLQQFGDPYWAVVADVDGRQAIDWGIYGAPETFLVDGDGVVRWKHIGVLTDDEVRTSLMPALAAVAGGG